MKKTILYIALLTLTNILYSQTKTYLPYSIFAVGDLQEKAFVRNMGMGRVGIALSSGSFLNNINPASYNMIDSISFFFDAGLSTDILSYSSQHITQKGNDINARHIAMGFRVNKRWGTGIGVAPYSKVGYKIITSKNVEGTSEEYAIELTGSGGLTQFYWDNSFLLFKGMSIGVNVSYIFGNITTNERVSYSYLSNDIKIQNDAYLNKLVADFGFQYSFQFKEKWHFAVGGIYGSSHRLRFNEEIIITDLDGYLLSSDEIRQKDYRIPWHFGAGLSAIYNNRLLVAADYEFHNWEDTPSDNLYYNYSNTNTFKIGAEFIPGNVTRLGYLGGIRFRAGYYNEDYYIKVNNVKIRDQGITLGIGAPFLQNKTSINLAYSYSIKGTQKQGLIREKRHSILISFTLHDWWFRKYQYD